MTKQLLLGQVLSFDGNPFETEWTAVAHHRRRGAVLLEGGVIAAVDEADSLRARHPDAEVTDYGDALISAGFIDTHMHYPQTGIIASWGKRLIDWLNTYTFPEEARFADPAYACAMANRTLDLALAHGTTTLTSFGTIHPGSVDAFFEAAAQRGMRVVAGKTCMDRPETTPDFLRDTAQSAYDDSKALLDKWHGVGRALYAITPRFSPTSTEAQLRALGDLWRERPEALMQTHLSEQVDEVEWVKGLYPQSRDYLDTYEAFGLLGEGAIYGHAIHLTGREIARLRDAGASLAHCPTSNTVLGSGLFDLPGLAGKIRVGIATDTAGGNSFSMLRVMAATYEIAQLRGTAIHPAQLMWLATEGGARALRQEGRIGHLGVGAEADLVILDLASTPAIAQRSARAADFWEALFPTLLMGDDRAVRDVWVNGARMAARAG
ncbi:guanine deaminase [Ketogulonicigenium vulgare]|uniref:guanine deaminase n=1 Tax=Ketogulonicigenium vulgare TaxID=92945 RepID=UPI0001E67B91|nr:guanine deaminase [Ketogulonicigenium vulgare]ADO43336.1 guanine deaminase [Ketogulonicigenium vulgare Y25]ALJ81738.1 guanine deaminase [Ketogulonicigenium vulgare]ANW34401.1 guanine deaminase [Ketogulonicigenium vulgare]AOZ55373.1 guanine deaminase [Ketogulonicigenium vulgare]